MRTTFTDDDEGKEVVNESGDEIGVVEAVEDGSAHVNPNPDILDSVSSKLGWGEADEDTYRLDDGRVERITENQVVVRD
jgi:hypothetical protein